MKTDDIRALARQVAIEVTGDKDCPWDGPQIVEFALIKALGELRIRAGEVADLRLKLDEARVGLASMTELANAALGEIHRAPTRGSKS